MNQLPASPTSLTTMLACGLAMTCLVQPVCAQDALGDGNALGSGSSWNSPNRFRGSNQTGQALDGGLYVGANGVRDLRNAPAPRIDFNINNLMATGSLAGDKNFRGDVGYLAPSDFRGVVGADSIYGALQGSALSQIQFVNSPLVNDRYSPGVGTGLYEYRRDYTPAGQIYTTTQASEINEDRIRLDRTSAYASSRNLYDTAVNASSLRLIREESKDQRLLSVEATPLQGIYTRVIDDSTLYAGLSFYDRAALASSVRAGETSMVGTPFRSPLSASESGESGEPDERFGLSDRRINNRIDSNIIDSAGDDRADAYERVIRELVMRYGDDDSVRFDVNPDVLERVRKEMDELRELTSGSSSLLPPLRSDESDEGNDGTTAPPDPGEEVEDTGSDANQPATEEEEAEARRAESLRQVERAAEIIRNGGSVESFSAGQSGRIRELMALAEERLKNGEFFDAEAQFDQVLRINPGNPLALFGRANAQLGAGLYLSSALSLRKLYGLYPELAGTDLAPDLLPNETRLRLSVSKMIERIQRGKDLPSYALCLAYIGRALKDRELMTEGLTLLDENEGSAMLAEFLMQVWLDEGTTVEESPVAPADPAE